MLAACTMLSPAVFSANTVEVSTSDVRKGAAFDNIKASWGKALSLGDFKVNLKADYDYNDSKDFIKEVQLAGNVLDDKDNDVTVGYEAKHNFKDKLTSVLLSATTKDTTLTVDYDTASNVKEVSLDRSVDVAEKTVALTPSWLVQAKTARVKMMSALGGGNKNVVTATVDYATDDSAVSYEVEYSTSLEDGKDVKATYSPSSNVLNVEYTDSKFEADATWKVNAGVDTANIGDVLSATKVTLTRAWTW